MHNNIQLIQPYLQPHRKYHNLTHIAYMLSKAQEYRWTYDEMIYAILGHDIVYIIGSSNNEEESVEYLKTVLTEQEIDLCEKTEVFQAILDTKTHIPTTELSKYLIDLDLGILSEFWDNEYNSYIKAIMKEYLTIYSITDFYKGRISWIESMLSRDRIFYTRAFKIREVSARHNLEKELLMWNDRLESDI